MFVSGSPRVVLVVEDERIIAVDLQRRLSRLGYLATAVAGTAEDALRIAAECAAQVVIMDVHLRGKMDGIETARRLRAQGEFALIYLTGGADPADYERALTTAPAAWLMKPYTQQQLVAALELAEATLQRT